MIKYLILFTLLFLGCISCGCTSSQQPIIATNSPMNTSTSVPTTAVVEISSSSGTLSPTNSSELVSYQKGLELYQNGDYQGAIKAFNTTISLNKTNYEAYSARGKAFYQIGKIKQYEFKGNEEFNQAIADFGVALHQDLPLEYRRELFILRGYSNINIGDKQRNIYAAEGHSSFPYYEAAATDFTRVLENNPDDVDALIGRSLAYAWVGKGTKEVNYQFDQYKSDLARNDAQKACKLAPDNAWAHHALGLVMRNIDKLPPENSIKQLDEAIKDDPGEAWFYAWRGSLKISTKDYDGSRSDLIKAIGMKPRFGYAYNVLGLLNLKEGKKEEALVNTQKGLEINPNVAFWWYNFGLVQNELFKPKTVSHLEEVLKSYDRAIAIDPEYEMAHYERWETLMFLNRIPEAKEEIRIVKTIEWADPSRVDHMQYVTDNPFNGGKNYAKYG